MTERPYKVLFVSSHVVQYASVFYRALASDPRLQIQVAYCSLQGAESGVDKEFGREVKWDVPLLDGYPWIQVKNRAQRPRLGSFFGLVNTELWDLIRRNRYDAVVIYTGYLYASFWIAIAAAKWHGCKILFGTDAHEISSLELKKWKAVVKARLWPWIFRIPDIVIVPSNASVRLMRSLRIPPQRIAMTPYVVDNEWWLARAAEVDREAVRSSWRIPAAAPVILFCAKLQPWKRPQDALAAFARAGISDAFLVFAGDGPLRAELESQAAQLGIADRLRFLGFQNQSQLPGVYCASDVLVLPSQYDAFGVVVNEAMLCGCAPIVSDRVGAGYDLVRSGETGYVFPCGDVDALSNCLRQAFSDPQRLRQMKNNARARMETWSPRENIAALIEAIQTAVNHH